MCLYPGEIKMNKISIGLLCISLIFTQSSYYGSTTAPVTLAGGIIKAKHSQETAEKYKRKDCPVCKGKGWYMSGDGILKIECTYCELDKKGTPVAIPATPAPPTSYRLSNPNCVNGQCKPGTTIRR